MIELRSNQGQIMSYNPKHPVLCLRQITTGRLLTIVEDSIGEQKYVGFPL